MYNLLICFTEIFYEESQIKLLKRFLRPRSPAKDLLSDLVCNTCRYFSAWGSPKYLEVSEPTKTWPSLLTWLGYWEPCKQGTNQADFSKGFYWLQKVNLSSWKLSGHMWVNAHSHIWHYSQNQEGKGEIFSPQHLHNQDRKVFL